MPGATSVFDGFANTKALVDAGSDLAKWAADLQLGDGTVVVELAKNGYAKLTIDGVPEEQYNYYLMKTDFVADETAPIATTSEETKAE